MDESAIVLNFTKIRDNAIVLHDVEPQFRKAKLRRPCRAEIQNGLVFTTEHT